jgi:hypothetical protein
MRPQIADAKWPAGTQEGGQFANKPPAYSLYVLYYSSLLACFAAGARQSGSPPAGEQAGGTHFTCFTSTKVLAKQVN